MDRVQHLENRLSTLLHPSRSDHGHLTATRVLVGLNWTMVSTEVSTGLVQSPNRDKTGCAPVQKAGSYSGQRLADLAELRGSPNPLERSIGVAACNAAWNSRGREKPNANGLDLVQDKGHRTVIVGRFPDLDRRLPNAAILEREPRNGEFGAEKATDLIPGAEYLVITASTITNGTLAGLLALNTSAYTVLIGPGTPLCEGLFDLGINALSGFSVSDEDKLAGVISEGGAVRQFKPTGRNITITRD